MNNISIFLFLRSSKMGMYASASWQGPIITAFTFYDQLELIKSCLNSSRG